MCLVDVLLPGCICCPALLGFTGVPSSPCPSCVGSLLPLRLLSSTSCFCSVPGVLSCFSCFSCFSCVEVWVFSLVARLPTAASLRQFLKYFFPHYMFFTAPSCVCPISPFTLISEIDSSCTCLCEVSQLQTERALRWSCRDHNVYYCICSLLLFNHVLLSHWGTCGGLVFTRWTGD